MPTPWGTLSTTTGWPKRSVSLLPMVRATRSGLPPAAVGMMIRSGRAGQVPVWAAAGETAASAAPYRNVLRVSDIRRLPPATAGLVLREGAAGRAIGNCCASSRHRPATARSRPDRRGNIRRALSSLPARRVTPYARHDGRYAYGGSGETPSRRAGLTGDARHELHFPHVRRRRRAAAAAVQGAPARPFRAVAHRS